MELKCGGFDPETVEIPSDVLKDVIKSLPETSRERSPPKIMVDRLLDAAAKSERNKMRLARPLFELN
jgi:hypothetical protein